MASMLGTTETELKQLTSSPASIRTSFPNAMVTTYTHKPLVGITSITDPKGLRTSFEYDSQGRLRMVKDSDGNLLSETEYNYRQN